MAQDKLPDNRLDQIKEGAGLEESRLNVEFIEFIRKWSTPVLVVLALLSLGYFFWNKQKEARAARVDEAFEQLNQSTETASPSPDALRRIAEDYKSVDGVRVLAKLGAADEYLRAVRRGVKPGTQLNADGGAESPEDVLTDEDRARFLAEAETLYKEVHALTADKPEMALQTLSALYGLAAVSESRGDRDAARNVLDQAKTLAIRHGFIEHAALTQQRIDALPEVMKPVSLYHKSELPEIPALKPPVVLPPETPAPDETVGPQPPETDAPGEGTPPEGGGEATDSEAGEAQGVGGEGDPASADDDGR